MDFATYKLLTLEERCQAVLNGLLSPETSLKIKSIILTGLTHEEMDKIIHSLPNLKQIDLFNNFEATAELFEEHDIRYFNCRNCRNIHPQFLVDHPHLRTLDWVGCVPAQAEIAKLHELRSLCTSQMTDSMAEGLPLLEQLYVMENNQLTAEGYQKMPHLMFLCVCGPHVTDASLQLIPASIPQVECHECSQITKDGILQMVVEDVALINCPGSLLSIKTKNELKHPNSTEKIC